MAPEAARSRSVARETHLLSRLLDRICTYRPTVLIPGQALTYTQVRTTMSEAGRTNIIMISSNNGHSYLLVEAAGCTWRELDEFLSTEEEADAASESPAEAATAHEGRDGKPSLHQARTQPAAGWCCFRSVLNTCPHGTSVPGWRWRATSPIPPAKPLQSRSGYDSHGLGKLRGLNTRF